MYAFILMAIHPEVQDKLFEEVTRVCGDGDPDFTHLSDLVYALCVTYETMRLFPFVGSIPHLAITDQILTGKYCIPAGTQISLDYVNIGRHQKYWGINSNKFDPSRWLEGGKVKTPARGTFVGFSDGPRACLGIKLDRIKLSV